MIDLFSVKLNGEYDEIGVTPTIENGLFLCDTTGDEYTRGYSYEITEGEAKRVDTVQDYKIEKAIIPTIQSVCNWLNNWFIPKLEDCHGSYRHPVMPPSIIKTGDLIKADFQGVSFVGYATVNDDKITIDNQYFSPDVNYTYYLIQLPSDVEQAISQMIYYDIYTRGTVDGLKSESVGSYSYTLEDTAIGSLSYPSSLVSGLELNYRKVRFVQ